MENILQEIRKEREYQNNEWGDGFDSKNTPNDWLAYIVGYTGKALTPHWNSKVFRTSLIKVATLCVAAIECCDKTNGNMPKRHYDE